MAQNAFNIAVSIIDAGAEIPDTYIPARNIAVLFITSSNVTVKLILNNKKQRYNMPDSESKSGSGSTYSDDSEQQLIEAFESAIAEGDAIEFIESRIINGTSESLNYAFYAACLKGHYEKVALLLSMGVDKNFDAGIQNGVLAAAAINNYPEVARLLLHNQFPDLPNNLGDTALDLALRLGHHAVVREFGEGDLTQFGYTTLMIALIDKDYERVLQILEHASVDELNMVTHGGFAPLTIAAVLLSDPKLHSANTEDSELEIKYLQKIILELLKKGANPTWKNKKNISLLSNYDPYHPHLFFNDEFFKQTVAICCSDEFMARHNGRNIFHIGFMLDTDLVRAINVLPNFDAAGLKAAFLNRLDNDGNSPLSFLLLHGHSDDSEIRIENEDVINLVEIEGAKFIRNGVEIKSKYHIGVLCGDGLGMNLENFFDRHDLTFDEYKSELEKLDENGRNVLHLGYINALGLIEHLVLLKNELEINFNVKDAYGRLPMHYITESSPVFYYEFINFLIIPDNDGLTPLILYFQRSGRFPINLDVFLRTSAGENVLERLRLENRTIFTLTKYLMELNALDINNNTSADALLMRISNETSLSFKQKLALLGAFDTLYNMTDNRQRKKMVDTVAETVIYDELKSRKKLSTFNFTPGLALGVELEIPEQPDATCVNFHTLVRWFGFKEVQDRSLYNSSLSLHKYARLSQTEVITSIIQSNSDYNHLLEFCNIVKTGGAKVNVSAGMHVHINCRGSDRDVLHLPRLVPKDRELVYLKYLALNYINIESLLRGFMRDGMMFDQYGASYVQPLGQYKDKILAARSVKELQQICTHNKTLDFTALSFHGTTEFRVHEGAVDPILVNAWVETVVRLALISKQQALAYNGGEITAKPDIEQLVYLLITLREYQTTWDPQWGAVLSSETQTTTAYPGHDSRPAQIQIQQAPLYNMMRIILHAENLEDAKNSLAEYLQSIRANVGADERGPVLNELVKLLSFAAENPGLKQFPVLKHKEQMLQMIDSLRNTRSSPTRHRLC